MIFDFTPRIPQDLIWFSLQDLEVLRAIIFPISKLDWTPEHFAQNPLSRSELLVTILAEVKTFPWEAKRTNWMQEIYVGDHTILVQVNLFEDRFELLIGHLDAPFSEERSELAAADSVVTGAALHVFVGLANRLPLLPNFGPNHLLELGLRQVMLDPIFELWDLTLLLTSRYVVLLQVILAGVVTEVKAFWLVNRAADPLAKVGVGHLVGLTIFIAQIKQNLHLTVVDGLVFSTEKINELLHGQIAIVV